MKAIFNREMKAYFTSPMGYVIIAIMLFFLGQGFTNIFVNDYGNLAYVFVFVVTYAMLIAPIITMRLFSEEKKQKTDQLLLTSPVKIWKIVMGKFLAALVIFMLCFAVTLIFEIILAMVTEVNWMLYLSCLLGMFLMGAAMLSIGVFISSLTESQIISAILGIIASLSLLMVEFFASIFNVGWLTSACTYISFNSRFNSFASGVIDFSNIIFFLSVTALFLFLTTRSLEKKRWA